MDVPEGGGGGLRPTCAALSFLYTFPQIRSEVERNGWREGHWNHLLVHLRAPESMLPISPHSLASHPVLQAGGEASKVTCKARSCERLLTHRTRGRRKKEEEEKEDCV